MTQVDQMVTLDTTDVDRYVGKPVGGGQLKDPVSLTDVRRWVQGMDHPNPLHYDEDYAAGSTFGRIVRHSPSRSAATSGTERCRPSSGRSRIRT